MEKVAYFSFHGNLQTFFKPGTSSQDLNYHYTGTPAVKDAVEAMGVPHVEVAAITVNKQAATFEYKLQENDRVEVYPIQLLDKVPRLQRLNGQVPDPRRFVLDVHLGKLARLLRMLGFDAVYQTAMEDAEIAVIAETQKRIVLTRDLPLLKRKNISFGYWLRSQQPEVQLQEVILQFDLLSRIHPFVRCINCNGSIKPVSKEKVLAQLEPDTRAYFKEFYQCNSCHRVYWKGTHYERMEKLVAQIKGGKEIG